MRVFVDTNVLIDFVCNRTPYAESAKNLFAYGYIGKYTLLTSALSFVNTMYVAHRYNHDEVKGFLKRVACFVDVVDLRGNVVVDMLSSDWKDYEDATQNQSAVNALAECIVTRNKKDFENSPLPVYTPEDFLNKF